MRNTFASEVTALAQQDKRIVLLSGDIGNRLFDGFKKAAAERFFNCGVAEANMIGVAAGLAMQGLRPITYTINSFTTARCFEQIKLDVCYQKMPVIMVGVGAGLGYASLGPTHQSLEDVAMLRTLPGLTVCAPADSAELRAVLRAAIAHDGPTFIRIGKKGEPVVHKDPPQLSLGKALVVAEGQRVAILSTGTSTADAKEAAGLLREKGIHPWVVSFPTVKPLDTEVIAKIAASVTLLVTVEDHGCAGGFGGSVAELLSAQPHVRPRLVRLGAPDTFLSYPGSAEYTRAECGIDACGIAETVTDLLSAG